MEFIRHSCGGLIDIDFAPNKIKCLPALAQFLIYYIIENLRICLLEKEYG